VRLRAHTGTKKEHLYNGAQKDPLWRACQPNRPAGKEQLVGSPCADEALLLGRKRMARRWRPHRERRQDIQATPQIEKNRAGPRRTRRDRVPASLSDQKWSRWILFALDAGIRHARLNTATAA